MIKIIFYISYKDFTQNNNEYKFRSKKGTV